MAEETRGRPQPVRTVPQSRAGTGPLFAVACLSEAQLLLIINFTLRRVCGVALILVHNFYLLAQPPLAPGRGGRGVPPVLLRARFVAFTIAG